MDYYALLMPFLLIVALFVGLFMLKRHLFDDEPSPPPIPIPDARISKTGAPEASPGPTLAPAGAAAEPQGPSLSPARLYARPALTPTQTSVFARLLKSLPGYVVLPKITYDHFLEARDGSPSENRSLQNRAAQHLADFIICDKKLRVLLVCQVDDGTQVPARVQEREKMLQKSGLRLLRWNVSQPPDPAKLLKTIQTLDRMGQGANRAASSSAGGG